MTPQLGWGCCYYTIITAILLLLLLLLSHLALLLARARAIELVDLEGAQGPAEDESADVHEAREELDVAVAPGARGA